MYIQPERLQKQEGYDLTSDTFEIRCCYSQNKQDLFRMENEKKKSVGGWMDEVEEARGTASCNRSGRVRDLIASGGHRAGHAVRSFFFFFCSSSNISVISLAILVSHALHL